MPSRPIRLTLTVRVLLAGCVLYLVHGVCTVAQESPPDEKAELAELFEQAREYEIRTTKSNNLLTLRESPILNFTNPERNHERGSVLLWMQDDRPAVIGQFFHFGLANRRGTKNAFHSLLQEPLTSTVNGKVMWTPDEPGIEWKSFSDAPPVAQKQSTRLLQIRQLVRPFKVTLFNTMDMPTELRLIPKPLFEYSAPQSGVTDGTIFSYVVATDPEAILLVEAFDQSGKTGFRYAFARFHFWRLTASHGDGEVWSVPFDEELMRNTMGNPSTFKRVYNTYRR